MGLFRRREPLHVRLAREGGLLAQPAPHDTTPRWGEAGIHGVARPRAWDALVTLAAELPGKELRFVALPDGTLVVEAGSGDPAPLAAALAAELEPPYRAEAVAREEGIWVAGARRIRVVRLEDHAGSELELALRAGNRTLLVDGLPAFGSVPALEALVEGDGVVRARRITGDIWEVQVDRL